MDRQQRLGAQNSWLVEPSILSCLLSHILITSRQISAVPRQSRWTCVSLCGCLTLRPPNSNSLLVYSPTGSRHCIRTRPALRLTPHYPSLVVSRPRLLGTIEETAPPASQRSISRIIDARGPFSEAQRRSYFDYAVKKSNSCCAGVPRNEADISLGGFERI